MVVLLSPSAEEMAASVEKGASVEEVLDRLEFFDFSVLVSSDFWRFVPLMLANRHLKEVSELDFLYRHSDLDFFESTLGSS